MSSVYRVAGIDVHKKMLAVVISDIATGGGWEWERRTFGTPDSQLRVLAAWLAEQEVREVVMESTAQYWMPVWRALEPQCTLHLAHAQSNRAAQGRKRDFADAERLVRRFVAGELILSFVPAAEQRLWRPATRARYQLTCDRVRLQNQLEALLEDAPIKLSSCVSDLLGLSSRHYLAWCAERNIGTIHIQPGKPTQNAYASHCTSLEQCGMTEKTGRRRESFVPCAFWGVSGPTGSKSCSGLSV